MRCASRQTSIKSTQQRPPHVTEQVSNARRKTPDTTSSITPHRRIARLRATAHEEDHDLYITTDFTPEDAEILAHAEEILAARFRRLGVITDTAAAARFLRARLAHLDREEFHAVWLDTQHRVICVERLFIGTIDVAEVHPREVVRAALRHNAAAAIFAHNHPSGSADPSFADRAITSRLGDALALIEVRLLDHFIIGANQPVSLAAKGYI